MTDAPTVPDARAAIAEACEHPTVRRDPMVQVLAALDAVLAALEAHGANRGNLSPDDRAIVLARVDRVVRMRERQHLLRTAGAMAVALLVAAGGGWWWGQRGASVPVTVSGTEARAACVVAHQVVQDGRRYCAVWLDMQQVGVVKAEAGR